MDHLTKNITFVKTVSIGNDDFNIVSYKKVKPRDSITSNNHLKYNSFQNDPLLNSDVVDPNVLNLITVTIGDPSSTNKSLSPTPIENPPSRTPSTSIESKQPSRTSSTSIQPKNHSANHPPPTNESKKKSSKKLFFPHYPPKRNRSTSSKKKKVDQNPEFISFTTPPNTRHNQHHNDKINGKKLMGFSSLSQVSDSNTFDRSFGLTGEKGISQNGVVIKTEKKHNNNGLCFSLRSQSKTEQSGTKSSHEIGIIDLDNSDSESVYNTLVESSRVLATDSNNDTDTDETPPQFMTQPIDESCDSDELEVTVRILSKLLKPLHPVAPSNILSKYSSHIISEMLKYGEFVKDWRSDKNILIPLDMDRLQNEVINEYLKSDDLSPTIKRACLIYFKAKQVYFILQSENPQSLPDSYHFAQNFNNWSQTDDLILLREIYIHGVDKYDLYLNNKALQYDLEVRCGIKCDVENKQKNRVFKKNC
ncbi:hypothetical protein QTN25_005024 [Entamoeba marina]